MNADENPGAPQAGLYRFLQVSRAVNEGCGTSAFIGGYLRSSAVFCLFF
jgi:hypothetical protein